MTCILCVGEGDTYESAVKDHDRNLICSPGEMSWEEHQVESKEVTIEKARSALHVLAPDGLKPDPSKAKAIVAMPTPSDKKACKGFLEWLRILRNFCLTCLMWRNRWDVY